MLTKNATIQVKAGPDDGLKEGEFVAYASVFGNKDSYGDVVVKGAFADTLAEWKAGPDVIPTLWGHDVMDPESNIGHVLEAKEDDHGLLVKVQLDPESSKAATVYRLLKGRRVSKMSFAYEVLDSAHAKSDELGDHLELRKLNLFEVSVVPIPANAEAEILAVKHGEDAARRLEAGLKAGRVISAKNETELRNAHEAIGRVLAALEPNDSGKASGTGPAKNDEPAGAKFDEPSRNPSVDSLAAAVDVFDIELSVA